MSLSDKVKARLQELPSKPGVYLMRDRQGRIIYVGKAASLRSRVQSYFRKGTLRSAPPKLRGLIHSIDSFDFIVLRTEAEATLTEGRMIKDYRPRYNVDFRDDKRFLLLRVNIHEPFPRFDLCRIQKDDGALYFGPYASSQAARAALEFMDKRFGLRRCKPRDPGPADHKHCLNDIVRFCSAPCIARIAREAYLARVEEACAFLRGERPDVLQEIRAAMEKEAEGRQFEKAAALRDTLLMLQRLIKERTRARKSLELRESEALDGVSELRQVLHLDHRPRVIEAYDISNISGTHAVGSMVCAVDGVPHKNRYRLFRIKTIAGSDDPGMMAEVIRRRYSRNVAEHAPMPDLVLVDGGITQLRAARAELDRLGLAALPAAGLAKQFEEIHTIDLSGVGRDGSPSRPSSVDPGALGERALPSSVIRLPLESNALKVLRQIRDEAHRFALTYHRRLRLRRIRESVLDEVRGLGDRKKAALLQHFGSVTRLRKASPEAIAAVSGIGPAMARAIRATLDSTVSTAPVKPHGENP